MKPTTAALTLRKATFVDGPFLLAMRNSDDVRSQSKTKEIIPEETHRKWLQAHLNNPDTAIWIIEHSGKKHGYIRAQRLEDRGERGNWLLSIALQRSARGQGHASWALREACRLMREDIGAESLVAEVFATNEAACRLFRNAGFVDKAATAEDQSSIFRFEFPLG